MGLFKRKRKDETPQPNTVVVKVPATPTECVVPEEHALLAKIRSLQGERVEIVQFLKDNKVDKYTKMPEFDALVDLIADICPDVYTMSAFMYSDVPRRRILCERIRDKLKPRISEIDFASLHQETLQLKALYDTITSKRKRLKDIDDEIKAIKSSLGIAENES